MVDKDEYVELEEIPSQSRIYTQEGKASRFFGRMKRGFGKAKSLAEQYKQRQAEKQLIKSKEKEEAMERMTKRAEGEAKFVQAQAKRMKAQKSIYELAAARNVAKTKYMGESMRFPIDMSLQAVRPLQQQPKKTKQKPQFSLDKDMVNFMRR